MKFIFTLVAFLFFCLNGLCQTYTAATYNLRLNIESDEINRWDNRKVWLTQQIKTISPDILGTQEGLPEQISFLDSVLTEYNYVGVGREDGKTKGEYAAVFFKNNRFLSLKNDTFWLSETPDTVSKGWGANYERICTYSLLLDKNNDHRIWVFNAHLDHESKQARLESVKLIWQTIQKLNTENYPILLMGDFNAKPDSPPILFITKHLNDSKTVSKNSPIGPEGTFNGFDVTHPLDSRIDYIFVDKNVEVQDYTVINEIKENRTPSDHLPVVVNISISQQN